MKAEQIDGRVAIVTTDLDEFGEQYQTERMMDLESARRLRDELSKAIRVCEEMRGWRDGVFVGTD